MEKLSEMKAVSLKKETLSKLLHCFICRESFSNDPKKEPTMVRCCCETSCAQCWEDSWAKDPETGKDVFKCPYKCGRAQEDFKVHRLSNKFLIEQLKKEQQREKAKEAQSMGSQLECSKHPGKFVTHFNTVWFQFNCESCKIEEKEVIPITKVALDRACNVTGEILTNKMFEYLTLNVPMEKWMKDILQTSQLLQQFNTTPSTYKSEELQRVFFNSCVHANNLMQ